MDGYYNQENHKLDHLALLDHYLRGCSKLTEELLAKAVQNKLTMRDSDLAKEISHVANILCAIYFYRRNKNLDEVLQKIPASQRRSMQESLKIVWRHIEKLDESQLADLAIEAIQNSSKLSDQIRVSNY